MRRCGRGAVLTAVLLSLLAVTGAQRAAGAPPRGGPLPAGAHVVYSFPLTTAACAPMVMAYVRKSHGIQAGLSCSGGAYHVVWHRDLGILRPLEMLGWRTAADPRFLATWGDGSGTHVAVSAVWRNGFAPDILESRRHVYLFRATGSIVPFGVNQFDATSAGTAMTYRWDGNAYTRATPADAPLPRHPSLRLLSGGRAVAVTLVGVAATPDQQSLGLMDVRYLAPNAGMLFQFAGDTTVPFWMEDTPVPLAIAFIDASGKILDIQEMAAFDSHTLHSPCGQSNPCPYRYALEVNPHFFTRHHIPIGAAVRFKGL